MIVLVSTASPIGIANIFTVLFALVFVVVLAIYFTKWLATGRFKRLGRNIKIIESIGLGQNNAIFLLKIGTKYVLIGASKESTNFLFELDENEIQLEQNTEEQNFTSVLNKLMKGKKDE